jgi:ornithine cyclodeaminase/alanine dehydrogenase-like protein (mu-crystallin family)
MDTVHECLHIFMTILHTMVTTNVTGTIATWVNMVTHNPRENNKMCQSVMLCMHFLTSYIKS